MKLIPSAQRVPTDPAVMQKCVYRVVAKRRKEFPHETLQDACDIVGGLVCRSGRWIREKYDAEERKINETAPTDREIP